MVNQAAISSQRTSSDPIKATFEATNKNEVVSAVGRNCHFRTFPTASLGCIGLAFYIDRWGVIENEEIGLDYAAVPLEEMYCRALQAGGAISIDKSAWGGSRDRT